MSKLAENRIDNIGESGFRSVINIHGVVLLVIAALHVSWSWFFPGYDEFSGLTDVQWSWIYLLNWCLSIFMFLVAFFSLAVGRMANLTINQLRIFIFSLAIFWSFRLLFEFIYPVGIPFLFIPDPSIIFKILLPALILVLLIPEIRLRSASNETS